jgi:hypothetical protein
MAVRKIGINCRSMTGRDGYSGQQFESTLERDLLDLLAFDLSVERYETQPVRLYYDAGNGQTLPYTPDALIIYRPDAHLYNLLVEVKFREEYRARFSELKRRFRAAQQHAREQGWRFCVLTEREIRTPYLDNARFLRPYREHASDPDREHRLLERVRSLKETTPTELLQVFEADALERARYLAVLWKLVSEFRIRANLAEKITMRSQLRPFIEE